MKTIYTLLLISICFVSTLLGQEEQFRVISCYGEVIHQTNDKEIQVVAGAKINPEGMLVLNEDSRIKLICKDKPYAITEKGAYDLESLYKGSAQRSMSFTGKFWNFIMDGLKKSDSKDDLISYHKKYASVSGGIKGYSSKNSDIKILRPYSGKITNGDFVVSWDSKLVGGKYTISILNGDDRYPICKKSGDAMSLNITQSECMMVLGNTYFLRVESDDKVFDEIPLEYVQLDNSKIDRRLTSLLDYEKSTDEEKAWMRATVLEMEGYVEDAFIAYSMLVDRNPKDGFVTKLYNLFLARNNQIDKINTY